MPQPVVDFLYRHRFHPALRAGRRLGASWLGDTTRGVPITRGPLLGMQFAFSDSMAMWVGGHESAVMAELMRLLRPGMVAYDIGAHVGYTVLGMARAVGSSGRVVAYEPDGSNLELLHRNIELNDLRETVAVRTSALGAEPGSGALQRGHLSVLTRVELSDAGSVVITTLDEEVFGAGLPAPSLVVIDVEGMELDVLRGARRVLAEFAPIVVCEDQDYRAEVMELMHGFGYESRLLDIDHTLYTAAVPDARRSDP